LDFEVCSPEGRAAIYLCGYARVMTEAGNTERRLIAMVHAMFGSTSIATE
jgi:hypothetical protein